jgi:hypothetical protein
LGQKIIATLLFKKNAICQKISSSRWTYIVSKLTLGALPQPALMCPHCDKTNYAIFCNTGDRRTRKNYLDRYHLCLRSYGSWDQIPPGIHRVVKKYLY